MANCASLPSSFTTRPSLFDGVSHLNLTSHLHFLTRPMLLSGTSSALNIGLPRTCDKRGISSSQ